MGLVTSFIKNSARITAEKEALLDIPGRGSLLGRAGKGLLELVNVPSNVTKSLILGATDDPEYFINALKTLSPFHEGEYISAEKFTATKNFWANLAFDIATDPLTYVGGLGSLTKAGTAAKSIKASRKLIKATEAIGKEVGRDEVIERALRGQLKELKFAKKTLKSLKGKKKRSVIKINLPFQKGGLHLGDPKNWKRTAAAFDFLADQTVGRIPLAARKKLRGAFITGAKLPEIQALKDITRARTDLAVEKFGKEAVEIAERMKTLLELDDTITQSDIITAAEGRHLSEYVPNEQMRNIIDARQSSIEELVEAYGPKAKAAKEAGDEKTLKALRDQLKQEAGKVNEGIKDRILNLKSDEFLNPITKRFKESSKSSIKKFQDDMLEASKLPIKEFHQVKAEAVIKLQKRTYEMNRALVKETSSLGRMVSAWEKISQSKAGPEFIQFIDEIIRPTEDLVRIAKAKGIKLDYLTSSKGLLSHVHRLKTPEARKLAKKDPQRFESIISEVRGELKASHKRTLLPYLDIPALNQVLKRKKGIDFDFFDTDISKIIFDQHTDFVGKLNSAEFAHTVLRSYAKTFKEKPKGFISGRDLFKAMKLEPKVIEGNLYLPASIAEDALSQYRMVNELNRNADGFVGGILRLVENVNLPYRALLTSPFPAFHHRNFISNIILNALGGVGPIRHFKYYWKARDLQQKAIKGILNKGEQKLWNEVTAFAGFRSSQQQELLRLMTEKGWGSLRDFTNRPVSKTFDAIGSKFGKAPKKPRPGDYDLLTGQAYGAYIENNARIAHYLAKRAEGLSPLSAQKSVNKYLFDYRDLTPFEQKYLRPAFLFYTWSRKNLPLMVNTAVKNPRSLAIYRQITGIDAAEVPDYLRGGFAFKAPPPFGPESYIGSMGVPFEDLNIFNVSDVDPDMFSQIKRAGQRIASRLAPVLRMPLEIMTGEAAFTQKPLRDMPFISASRRGIRGIIPELAAPTSRFTGTFNKIFLDDKPVTEKLIDALTGLRIYSVFPERAKLDTLTRRAFSQKLLRRQEIPVLTKDYKIDTEIKNILGLQVGEPISKEELQRLARRKDKVGKRAQQMLLGRVLIKERRRLLREIKVKREARP